MPLVSIIITNYNGRKYLKDCINSLKSGDFSDFELILVDNGSSDGSVDFVRDNYPEIKILELNDNLGLSIASNRGKELSQGRYLFFYNNDTVSDKVMLQELVKKMESDPNIGILGCSTLTYDGKNEINCGVQMDLFGYPYGKGKTFYVDAAIFIRRDVFEEIGGFDKKMFLYCEDRDLCWRTWLYGYKVVPVPSAIFRHDSVCLLGGGQFNTNIRRRFMNEAFTLRMLIKNYSLFCLAILLPLYFLINLAEVWVYLMRGEIKFILNTYLAAYFWNFMNLSETLGKRRIVQKNRKISDFKLLQNLYKGPGKFLLFRRVGIPNIGKAMKGLEAENNQENG